MTTEEAVRPRMGPPMDSTDIDKLIGRDLDAVVVERLLGWTPVKIGKDYDGENACEILANCGEIPTGLALPPRGKLHRGYLAPQYHRDLERAIDLAQRMGCERIEIAGVNLRELPTLIMRQLLKERLAAN